MWWMYFIFIDENRRMKSVEIVLRRGERENDEGGKSNTDNKHLRKYHNRSPYTIITC
jgi:hypothetical protein